MKSKRIGARQKAAVDKEDKAILGSAARGRYYGFPLCCLGAHVRNSRLNFLPENHPARGTGYIPCERCADRPWEEVVAEIQSQRLCTIPFPNGHHSDLTSSGETVDEEFKRFISEGRIANFLLSKARPKLKPEFEFRLKEYKLDSTQRHYYIHQ